MTTPWPKTSSAASSASASICAISPQGHMPWQTSSLISRPFTIRCARIPLLAGVLRMPSRVSCLSIPPPDCDTTRYPAFLSVFSSFLLSTKPGRAHIRDNEIGRHWVKASFHAFHRSIERFQINSQIGSLCHMRLPLLQSSYLNYTTALPF